MRTSSLDFMRSTRHNSTLCRVNPGVLQAKYAVRGRLALRAEQIRSQLKKGQGPPSLQQVVNCNIGNPQQLGQKPITFFRQVLAILQYPELASSANLPKDVVKRAKTLLHHVASVGSYSHSKGVPYIRQQVARFIQRRDGYASDQDSIFLTAGASAAVSYLMTLFTGLQSPQPGFLIPIPQYPLYSATLALTGARPIEYHLDESDNWKTRASLIEKALESAAQDGQVAARGLVVINPGNPTGAVLSQAEIEPIIDLAARYKVFIIADEVYQTNVYGENSKFVSFKKVLREMQSHHKNGQYDGVELASLHSTSKGMLGECGQRGGYVELTGFHTDVVDQLYKLVSIGLCPVVTGQCAVELMVDPPKIGDESYELYKKEYTDIFHNLKNRAHTLHSAFSQMDGVSCLSPQGAMYLFPKISIPPRAVEAAKLAGMPPDELYALELLEATGICVVPGSGFGQQDGTWHFRTTFLAPGDEFVDRFVTFHRDLMKKYK